MRKHESHINFLLSGIRRRREERRRPGRGRRQRRRELRQPIGPQQRQRGAPQLRRERALLRRPARPARGRAAADRGQAALQHVLLVPVHAVPQAEGGRRPQGGREAGDAGQQADDPERAAAGPGQREAAHPRRPSAAAAGRLPARLPEAARRRLRPRISLPERGSLAARAARGIPSAAAAGELEWTACGSRSFGPTFYIYVYVLNVDFALQPAGHDPHPAARMPPGAIANGMATNGNGGKP